MILDENLLLKITKKRDLLDYGIMRCGNMEKETFSTAGECVPLGAYIQVLGENGKRREQLWEEVER